MLKQKLKEVKEFLNQDTGEERDLCVKVSQRHARAGAIVI